LRSINIKEGLSILTTEPGLLRSFGHRFGVRDCNRKFENGDLPTAVQKSCFVLSDAERGVLNDIRLADFRVLIFFRPFSISGSSGSRREFGASTDWKITQSRQH
jgi:hypothetical protein